MAKTVLLGKEKEKQLKEQKKDAKKKNRKKVGFIKRVKSIFSELRKVSWPTWKNLVTYTLAVIAFIIIMAIITGIFDFGLGQLFSLIV